MMSINVPRGIGIDTTTNAGIDHYENKSLGSHNSPIDTWLRTGVLMVVDFIDGVIWGRKLVFTACMRMDRTTTVNI